MKLFLRDAAMFYGLGILSFLIFGGGLPEYNPAYNVNNDCGVADYRCP